MSDYEISLLLAVALLIVSLLTGFGALTNQRSVAGALVLFVLGGFTLYYAGSLNADSDFAADIPGAVYKLYAKVVN